MATRKPKPRTASPVVQLQTGPQPIRIAQGYLPEIIKKANGRLASDSPRLFRYGGMLIHVERLAQSLKLKGGIMVPTGSVVLEPATKEWLQLELARIATWKKARENAVFVEWCDCDPPMKIATAVLADRAGWLCRVLNGTSEVPILRDDGSICSTQGYDTATGIYYEPNGHRFPRIKANPTKADALAALNVLLEPLKDFPFVKEHHRSAALAMTLTGLIRRQLPAAPAFGVSAREAGTGKGKLIDVTAITTTGRSAPVTPFTDDEDEQRKRVTASLLAGQPIINIDNADAPVDSAALCALITSETWRERLLGTAQTVEAPTNVLIVVNGNNLVIQGDMTRRVIPIELDAKMERPELRTFNRDLLPWVEQHRVRLVCAALTVLSAWRKAGRPVQPNFVPLGSFEVWSLEIPQCLAWLAQPDPVLAMRATADPKRDTLRRMLGNWHALVGKSDQTVGGIMSAIDAAQTSTDNQRRGAANDLREVVDEITADARNDKAARTKLGIFIRKNAGRVVKAGSHDLRFIAVDTVQGAARWTVESSV